MRALQLEKPREFRFIDAPEAQPPGPGEALVRVRKVGVCGTDISGYLG
jgi:alcohol dehydrogenase